jgi:hypothetical protein
MKQLVLALEISLNPFSGFLFDGIHLHLDVISVYAPVLLDHLVPEINLIDKRWLQASKPLLRSTTQIQLHDFKQFVKSEVTDLGGHGQSLRPITDVFIISSPEQIVHPLGLVILQIFSNKPQSLRFPQHTVPLKSLGRNLL